MIALSRIMTVTVGVVTRVTLGTDDSSTGFSFFSLRYGTSGEWYGWYVPYLLLST